MLSTCVLTPISHPVKLFGLAAALALSAGLSACQKSDPPSEVLAQVDKTSLTLGDLRESLPPEYENVLPREQYLDFVQRWIDDEVIYRQALKLKVDQDAKMQRKLDRLRRKAVIEEFMAREALNQEIEPDEGAMSRYYEMHKEKFRRTNSEFRYAHIRVNTRKEAASILSKIQSGNFESLATEYSLDSIGENFEIQNSAGEIPSCFSGEIANAKPGWVSGPLRCPEGVFIVKLLSRFEAGSPLPFPEVKESISGQLALELRDKMREAKLRQYKEGVAINVNFDLIPGQESVPEKSEESGEAHVP